MKRRWIAAAVANVLAVLAVQPHAMADPVSGAIFTTDSSCTATNVNIYPSKDAVYLNGGPTHPGAAGLPDGNYYVQVTEPGGTSLGHSLTAVVEVVEGEFADCYQLEAILVRESDAMGGYDDTTNPGGEYKVWVSEDPAFGSPNSKTDNFKVRAGVQTANLHVRKFYDANANGLDDDGQPITGWQVRVENGFDELHYTPVDLIVEPDTYTVTESDPVENNWVHTTTNPVITPVLPGVDMTVTFGNVCVGAGGGRTLGFWSNKNGAALVEADDLAMLVARNLRSATGTHFDPASHTAFRTWLLSANATNMAYMLSAQLAAMELNALNGLVSGSALIYAPGTTSANPLGFASVAHVMTEANNSLGTFGTTLAGHPERSYQEGLKNALDRANNNLNFVQANPCPFSFLEAVPA